MNSPFNFVGQIPASKSLMNRALIVQSYFPELKIRGEAQAEDVYFLEQGIQAIKNYQPVECGEGGTVLRFLALRASRQPGEYLLRGSKRLFSRPQRELVSVLSQLGVQTKLGESYLEITSRGWKPLGDMLNVPSQKSSQFASAVLLNSWALDFPLFLSPSPSMVSEGYWKMTLGLVQYLGMQINAYEHEVHVPPGQRLDCFEYTVEMDMSSAFAIAAVAAVSGKATIQNFPSNSPQPDSEFPSLLKRMNVPIEIKDQILRVSKADSLIGIEVNLKNSPDLFPVLAALAALSPEPSLLYGAKHLQYKESDRIAKIAELLEAVGRRVQVLEDGLRIFAGAVDLTRSVTYDPAEDHRLAMAAAVLMQAGASIDLVSPQVVKKSYAHFWKSLGVEN